MNTVADLDQERAAAVRDTVSRIRQIEQQQGVTRASLEQIKQQLLRLAARSELFSTQAFPPPQPGSALTSCLYRIAEDADHRFALYVNSTAGRCDTPPHNHTTWAVIVGIRGDEHNRFYRRSAAPDEAPQQSGGEVVRPGSGVAFLPDDLHSIHIEADNEAVINFHMYGLALEQLHEREYYSARDRAWHVFAAHTDIREARPGADS